jgi:hypothetical protein
LNKSEIVVFKKMGRLTKNERWTMQGKNVEMADEITYLGTTLESTGRWEKHKKK